MKKVLIFLTIIFAINTGYGQQLFNQVKQKATEENKFILLNFSGSDWCIPCIKMQKDFFENTDFIRMADSQLIIIRADFPRNKKNMPAKEIITQNEWLADKFNPNGNFPFTLLISPDGKIVNSWDGKPDETAATFTSSILSYIEKYKQL